MTIEVAVIILIVIILISFGVLANRLDNLRNDVDRDFEYRFKPSFKSVKTYLLIAREINLRGDAPRNEDCHYLVNEGFNAYDIYMRTRTKLTEKEFVKLSSNNIEIIIED